MSNITRDEVLEAISVYKCYDRGIVLPLVNEYSWAIGLRAFLYLLGLLWLFLGVAIIADVFMCSIEKITSHTRRIRVASPDSEGGFEWVEMKVWNDTVANLTLMALGSSAPEILLSIIEIVGNKFKAGQLGPGTIVGSAAFNLLVIMGVCILSIPSPEVRVIKSIKVFAVTAGFSVFAYVWLILILMVFTPNYVDLWEAIVTLLFFPILVVIAYIADRDFCSGKKRVDDKQMELGLTVTPRLAHYIPWVKKRYNVKHEEGEGEQMLFDEHGRMNEKRMREFIKDTKKVHPNLKEDEIAQLAVAKMSEEQHHNHLWYRINAVRHLGGGHKLTPQMSSQLHEVFATMKNPDENQMVNQPAVFGSSLDMSESGSKSVIEFTSTQSAVLEGAGKVTISIRRYGNMNQRVPFKIETIDGTAEADQDYVPIKETMVFQEGESIKHLDIMIIDDNEWEPDEVFFVKLALDLSDSNHKSHLLGQKKIQEITIINDDEPGTFEFSKPSLIFKESAGKADIAVERTNGADGRVTIKWKTEDMSAVTGKDYEGGEGTLVFEHGEMSKNIEIVVYDDQTPEKDECFKVDLFEVSQGAKLGRINKTIITLVNDDEFDSMVSRLVDQANMNMDSLRVENLTWTEQFHNAMNVNGGQLEGASHMDYLMHFLTFAFKLLFAAVPPPSYCGGWLAFTCALGMIAILTALISDLAGTFGCLVGLKDSVTSITFVALGTSLPDLFASKQAACGEKTADNCIGNVTGSNSVNVFLGLGLPWAMAAIYWTSKGETFEVQAGSLGFSVTIYTLCAVVAICVILMRRYMSIFGPGELGGSKNAKYASAGFFFFLWIFYVVLSALQAYGHIKGF